jgi:2'-5' RNA ligase
MKYFLAVVPPIALATQIELFRAEWGQVGLPAHITAKAPNSLSATEEWLPKVKDFCQNSNPLSIRLDGIGQFAPAVVYWRVVAPALVAFHQSLLAIINPPLAEQAAFFEGPAYVPHLTLAHINNGLDAATLAIIHQRAVEQWTHPIGFVAQTLRVFRASGPNQSYEVYLDLPLAGVQATAG